MDAGSSGSQESQLRLRLIDAGMPRPRTNIVVGDDLWEATIAMGWDGPKVGVDCFDAECTDRHRAIQQIATEELFARRVRAALLQRRNVNRSRSSPASSPKSSGA
jgi:hypothetical protein